MIKRSRSLVALLMAYGQYLRATQQPEPQYQIFCFGGAA